MTKLDSASFATTTSPHTFSGLAQGPHTFTVEAIDQVGNVSQPVSYTWTVDTTPPTVSITQQPPAFTSSTLATFAFTGSDNITATNLLVFKTNLDGAGFVTATSPVTYTNLLADNHTFQVEDVDQAGNVSLLATVNWTIETSPPTVSITQQPAALTNSKSATFAFTGSDAITPTNQLVYKAQLDGSGFATATSPASYTNLTAGSHTFQVESINQAGLVSTVASVTWTIDTTPPTVSITQQPAAVTNSASATFAFTGSDSLTPTNQLVFMVQLDSSGFSTATSPVSYTNLTAGSHTFEVESIDQAGNVSTVASFAWIIDTTPPNVSITQEPASFSNTTSTTFAFTGSDNVTPANQLVFQVQLDNSGFATATSPVTYTSLAVGSHTFQVEAIDQAATSAQSRPTPGPSTPRRRPYRLASSPRL